MTNILVIWQGRLAGAVAPSTGKIMKNVPNFMKEVKIFYKMVYKTLYFGWSIPEKLRYKVKFSMFKKKALVLKGLNSRERLEVDRFVKLNSCEKLDPKWNNQNMFTDFHSLDKNNTETILFFFFWIYQGIKVPLVFFFLFILQKYISISQIHEIKST